MNGAAPLKRTDARGFPERRRAEESLEAAKNAVTRNRDAACAIVSSIQLILETEGAEPGSTNVDGSYRAASPAKVRDIMRTLLT
jgi:hypothetical protein